MIIPTHNRAESLRETLHSVACQETAGQFTYEVLVVDNGSSDHTRGVVEELSASFPVPLRFLYEGRPGQSMAINMGLQQARGGCFVFTDDDVLPTPTWLAALWRCLLEEQANGVAGRILPLWLAPRPAWLTDAVALSLGNIGCLDRGTQRLSSREHQDCRWVGGNMAIRREVFQQLGGFDTRLLVLENETEYYHRCLHQGFTVVYEPAALAYHKLGSERMTLRYFRQRYHQCGYYAAYWFPWRKSDLLTVMPIDRYRRMLRGAVSWAKHFATHAPWVERFYYELELQWNLSFWLHRLQLWPRWWWTVLGGTPSDLKGDYHEPGLARDGWSSFPRAI